MQDFFKWWTMTERAGMSKKATDSKAKSIAKERDVLAKTFMHKINEVQDVNNDSTSTAKTLEWSALINVMANHAHKHMRKLNVNEIQEVVRGAVDLVTGNRSRELISNEVFESGIGMALALQDEIFKTKCWGVCGKKTVG